jgi:hypothetical protein
VKNWCLYHCIFLPDPQWYFRIRLGHYGSGLLLKSSPVWIRILKGKRFWIWTDPQSCYFLKDGSIQIHIPQSTSTVRHYGSKGCLLLAEMSIVDILWLRTLTMCFCTFVDYLLLCLGIFGDYVHYCFSEYLVIIFTSCFRIFRYFFDHWVYGYLVINFYHRVSGSLVIILIMVFQDVGQCVILPEEILESTVRHLHKLLISGECSTRSYRQFGLTNSVHIGEWGSGEKGREEGKLRAWSPN